MITDKLHPSNFNSFTTMHFHFESKKCTKCPIFHDMRCIQIQISNRFERSNSNSNFKITFFLIGFLAFVVQPHQNNNNEIQNCFLKNFI